LRVRDTTPPPKNRWGKNRAGGKRSGKKKRRRPGLEEERREIRRHIWELGVGGRRKSGPKKQNKTNWVGNLWPWDKNGLKKRAARRGKRGEN